MLFLVKTNANEDRLSSFLVGVSWGLAKSREGGYISTRGSLVAANDIRSRVGQRVTPLPFSFLTIATERRPRYRKVVPLVAAV